MKKILTAATAFVATIAMAFGQSVSLYWNANTTSPTTPASLPSYITATPTFSQFNSSATLTLINSTSASSGYNGASGGNNFGIVVHPASNASQTPFSATGPAFAFSLQLESGYQFTSLTDFTYGSRRTGTGPQAHRLIASTTSDFSSGTTTIFDLTAGQTNSSWVFNDPTLNAFSTTGNQVFFRLYGYNGQGNVGNAANWRIDDITLAFTVVPEPATYALAFAFLLGVLVFLRRRRTLSEE